ncbi:MAG: hypothetical protein ACK5Q5_05435 [Planctomycetaceae bacterium]
MVSTTETLDLVEELRLRRWARENYVPLDDRLLDWHAVVLDEMERRDREERTESRCRRQDIVPLGPIPHHSDVPHTLRGPWGDAATATTSAELHCQ